MHALLLVVMFSVQFILFVSLGLFIAEKLHRKSIFEKLYIPIVAGLVSCLFSYAAFWLYLANTTVGLVCSYGFIIVSVAAIFLTIWKKTYRSYLVPDVIIPLVLMFFVGLFYTSTVFSCTKNDEQPSLAQQCHLNGLSLDNTVPFIFANNVFNNQEKNLIGDWQGSDRPPLQSGAVLLQAPLALGNSNNQMGYSILSTLLQCLWIPAVWLLGRKLKLDIKQIALLLGFCIFSGFFFFNSIFTWPKLLAGSLIILSISLFFFEKYSRTRWIIASLAAALGFLAHSSVVFTLIPIAVLLLLKRYNPDRKRILLFASVFLIICLPWLAYQNLYDSPGNRLVKWHIGGVVAIDSRSSVETVKDSYLNSNPLEIFKNKLSNVVTPLGVIPPESTLYDKGILGQIRDSEFRYILFGLGLLNIGWILLLVKRHRQKALKSLDTRVLKLLFVIAITSVISWTMLLFGPSATIIHAGSYTNMILLFVGLATLLTTLGHKTFVNILLYINIVYFTVMWIVAVWIGNQLHTAVVLLWALSLVIILLAIFNMKKIEAYLNKRKGNTSGVSK